MATAFRTGLRQSFKERQRDRALRVVDAQKQLDAAKKHMTECKAELEMAWTDLREHALNEDAALSPRQGGLEDEDDEG